ncbi:MAG: hypothetical protein HY647_03270 [Acidobacteria bacterium]|nr:hypothetical protein [Acidobacteriota bacterium]
MGEIRAKLVLPEGPWDFRKVELPEKAHWKVSVRQRKQAGEPEGESPPPQTLLELTFSAGSRAILSGMLGLLRISLPEEGTRPPHLTVAHLETSPPVPEVVGTDTPLPLPQGPPINPAVSCFFFTH